MSFNKTKIDWPGLTHTWNPITGCKRMCSYCYARRIHNRFFKTPFSDIVFRSQYLECSPPKTANRIFVGSMSDVEYWDKGHLQKIVDYCSNFPEKEFMFLSKNPVAYCDIYWPENTMQGLTVTKIDTIIEKENVCRISLFPRPYLSIEPLLGYVTDQVPDKIELVIVGAMTGTGATKVDKCWVDSVEMLIPKEKLHFKNTIPILESCGKVEKNE